MKPIYPILCFCIFLFSCMRQNIDESKTVCVKGASGTVICTDSANAMQLTPNPILIPDSVIGYPDTSQMELSLKMKDVPLKKISEIQSPGKKFLNSVKTSIKTGVFGRKMVETKKPVFTQAKPAIKLAGYPTFKKIEPLKLSGNGMYDIQHIAQRAQDICWSKDGSAWIASGLEISHIQGDYMESYGTAQGALKSATNVEIDNFGNVWSAYDGASYFDGKYFYTFSEKQGFTNHGVYTIFTPPWWQTWWARTGYGIMALLLILGYNRWRVASFKQRQKELETDIEVATFEIRKQKDEAETQRAKAEKSEQFKQQFLANMSHEIRTPMNAVMGMTSLVLGTPLNEKQKFYLEGIKKSSDNLLHIINDILDLSKIEAGKMELEHIDFSIHDLVDQVKQTLRHRADEKGLELIAMIKPDVPDVVMGDPTRLNQILINLAGNAIKFTEKGSVSIEVTNQNKGIQFAIVDTGIGIPKDKLQAVFESFSQANASDTRKYGGTGLGLSISRQLVGMMGSNIAIESVEGSGTTFSFSVKFEKGSAERLQQQTALAQSIDGSILDGLKILVTDDNEYNRIVARDTLKSVANLEIYEATNGQEAIDLVAKMQFDVILMDVQMPLMNGFEATRYIRENFGSPAKDTPIIALTASVLRTDLDKCKAAGMDSYIPKPFKSQQLITGIAQVLNITLKAKMEIETSSPIIALSGVTDMAYLGKFCEGDKIRMRKYINMFTSTAPGLIEKINSALDFRDFEEIANQVHSFKTKWVMMGMAETKDIALKLEILCREGSQEDLINNTIGLLKSKIEFALAELSEELNK